jgi:hypothetical protein
LLNVSLPCSGTGNGHLLFELLDLSPPFTEASQMLGIDYSKPSIDLCHRIAKGKGAEQSEVPFEVVDFLSDTTQLEKRRWDLICDKGTVSTKGLSFVSAMFPGPCCLLSILLVPA